MICTFIWQDFALNIIGNNDQDIGRRIAQNELIKNIELIEI